MRAYLTLTKPRISLLFALTGLAALVVEGSLLHDPLRLWSVVLAIFLTGGAANALNQYFERDIDARMARTARKRPLPQGLIRPASALWFSVIIGLAGMVLLWQWGGWLAMSLGLGTIGFYSFYYTLWLKPRTPYNIVIGGLAGATGPLIAWAAATGQVGFAALLMCAIIFFWTPPHFWALALCCKDDYREVGYPMLPLVVGDEATRRQIMGYSVLLIPLSASFFWIAPAGWLYLAASLLLSSVFVGMAWRLYTAKTTRAGWQLFGYSIVYVLLLFVAMICDALWVL